MKSLKKLLSEIKEKWYSGTKSNQNGDYREIFVNPSKSDIKDIEEFGGFRFGNGFRFIADKYKKKVYVGSGDVFHMTIAEEIGMDNHEMINEHFAGIGKKDGNKIKANGFTDAYEISAFRESYANLCIEIIDGEYDWMERYNFNLKYIKDLAKDELEWLRDNDEIVDDGEGVEL